MKLMQLLLSYIVVVNVSVRATILRETCKIDADFDIVLEGLADLGSRLKELTAKTKRECVLECVSLEQCVSLNHHSNGSCQLLARNLANSTPLLAKKDGWTYMTTNTESTNVSFYFLFYCLILKCPTTD